MTFTPALGYVSAASPKLPKSLVALLLAGLKRQVVASFLLRWKKADQSIAVTLDLDDAARAEVERRNSYA